jgi:RNA polymerase sigma-70 factor (ECF subfamily)
MGERRRETFLVLRAQTGDRAALEELFTVLQEPLYRYLLNLTNDAPLAEDVLQEVLVTIYRKLYWLREPELLRPWAYRIASREAFRQLKRERRWREGREEEEALPDVPAPAREDFAPEVAEQLPELLAALSPASRAVLVLHYWQDISLAETAEILGLSLGTVKSRLAYGLNTLRRALRERGLA